MGITLVAFLLFCQKITQIDYFFPLFHSIFMRYLRAAFRLII